MKNESEFKTLFKKSVTRAKGLSLSLAAPMIVGIPDLYVVVPPFIPLLLEAKWLGKIERDKFNRKVPFTPLQDLFLNQCHGVSPYSAMGLIGFIYQKQIHAVLVVHGTPLYYQMSHCFINDCAYTKKSDDTKVFNVLDLFSQVPIPKIAYAQPRREPSLYEHTATAN